MSRFFYRGEGCAMLFASLLSATCGDDFNECLDKSPSAYYHMFGGEIRDDRKCDRPQPGP